MRRQVIVIALASALSAGIASTAHASTVRLCGTVRVFLPDSGVNVGARVASLNYDGSTTVDLLGGTEHHDGMRTTSTETSHPDGRSRPVLTTT
jgi:hypothetical protein